MRLRKVISVVLNWDAVAPLGALKSSKDTANFGT